MKKLFLSLMAVLLAACAGSAHNGAPATIYDFGLPAARLVTDGEWSRVALDVKAPAWFDSSDIEYRLAYDDPLKLREYAGSRWAGAPALLLGQRLRQQLGVAGASSNVAVDCLLRVELQEFSQVFDSPQNSRGVLQGSVTLLGAKRQILAERLLTVEQPAATPDARGGVLALVVASDEVGKELVGWLARLEQGGKLKSCRNGK
jgi:cholesterol transport system auxiliary component